METKDKFLVIKRKDIKFLLHQDRYILQKLCKYIQERGDTLKNNYIVINKDEPYAKEVWNIIQEGEKKKEL